MRGVCFQVVCHLVLGWEMIAGGGKAQAIEPVELGRREQPQGIPAVTPDVADPRGAIEDDVVDAAPFQMVADREPGLPGADHGDPVSLGRLRLRDG